MHPQGKTVWVTGASSGIGQAFALTMAEHGARLLLSARRADKLVETASKCRRYGANATILPLDLGQPESIASAVPEASRLAGPIDMLINAGGIGQRGLAWEISLEVGRQIFEVDFWGAVQLTRLLIPGMMDRGSGQIVVVSSLTGKFGGPRRSYYSAAKHALHGWFDSLREELVGTNIEITLIVPGWVKTAISERALEADGTPHGVMDKGQSKGISPEECAKRSLPAIIAGKPEQLVGGIECAGVYLNRIWPGLFRRILRRKGIG